jgi:succinate dehydrogenase/fumarate reductase flavoprotein subunit
VYDVLDEFIETDVLVIGGGLAGCMAAVEANGRDVRVALAVEGRVGRSGCTPLAGGPRGADFMVDSSSISTVLGLDDVGPEEPDMRDSMGLFKEDVLEDGEYLNNQRMVDAYVSEAPRAMKRLIEMGLRVERVDFAHGSRFPRGVIALHSDIAATMIRSVKESPIELLEDTKMTDLLVADGRCAGGVGVRMASGDLVGVSSRAVVVATGGWQAAYHTGGSDELTGDGQAMALEAGAELVDMEFGTFHDRYLVWPPFASRDNFVWDYGVERELVNAEGDDVTSGAPPGSGRLHSIGRISEEVSMGRGSPHGGVYLRNPREALRDGYLRMGSIMADWDEGGVPFEVAVGSHYCTGGVRVNERTETGVPGLYAAGEASGGLFGARRIASALTEAAVHGILAGENASEFARGVESAKPDEGRLGEFRTRLLAPLERDEGVKPVELRRRVRGVTSRALSPYRTGDALAAALVEIRRMRTGDVPRLWASGTDSRRFNREWLECLSLVGLLACLEASARSALMREESRGFHMRADFPERDDGRWLRNLVVREGRGGMEVYVVPVVVTDVPPRGRG